MGYLVDIDRVVAGLLKRLMPDVLALPERDVDAIEELPLILWTVGNGAPTANGRVRLAQVWPVDFTVLHTQVDGISAHDACRMVADELAEAVIEGFTGGVVPGAGAVSHVTDNMTLPARAAGGSVDAKDIVQFDASWELVVRPAP